MARISAKTANRDGNYSPPRMSDWQTMDDNTWFDTPKFHSYESLVLRTIAKSAHKGMTVGELHRALGDAAIPRMTQDAIDGLVVRALIFERMIPSRYVSTDYRNVVG